MLWNGLQNLRGDEYLLYAQEESPEALMRKKSIHCFEDFNPVSCEIRPLSDPCFSIPTKIICKLIELRLPNFL